MRIGYWVEVPVIGADGKLYTAEGFREELSFASENGFDCVRLSYDSKSAPNFNSSKLQSLEEIGTGEIKALVRERGFLIENITSGGNHLDPDPETRKRWNVVLKETVDLCRILDVQIVATDVGSPAGIYIYGLPGLFGSRYEGGVRRSRVEEAIKMYAEVMAPMADYAESQGVKIAFENNFRAMAGNIAQGPYVWDRMFKAVPSRALGLRIDPSHFICLMISPVEAIIRKYGDRIYAVDGKDCEIIPEMLQAQGIYGNLWWRYRIPGYGDLNWPKVISALMDVGYMGGIILENEDPLFPGKKGVLMGAKYLRDLIPKKDILDKS
ncbi:MAG: sugar phosphate isomerase/epimerase [Candidatus Bathyarchaeia archaeon]